MVSKTILLTRKCDLNSRNTELAKSKIFKYSSISYYEYLDHVLFYLFNLIENLYLEHNPAYKDL